MRIKRDDEREVIVITEDVRVEEFILEAGDRVVILEGKKKKEDDDSDTKDDSEPDDTEEPDDSEEEPVEKTKKKKKEAILRKLTRGEDLTFSERNFISRNLR